MDATLALSEHDHLRLRLIVTTWELAQARVELVRTRQEEELRTARAQYDADLAACLAPYQAQLPPQTALRIDAMTGLIRYDLPTPDGEAALPIQAPPPLN